MTPTICGHERGALVIALRLIAMAPDERHYIACVLAHPQSTMKAEFGALADPTKLAELLAEASIAAGLDMSPNASLPNYDWTRFRVYPNHNGNIALDDLDQLNPNDLTLSQARAALLRILELPEGSTVDDAVKALSDVS
jgi:hypothetical protein